MTSAAPAELLVTGATGFLGRALVRCLRAEQSTVRLLVRTAPAWGTADAGLEVVVGDLGDTDAVDRAVAGARVVYHVAATTSGTADDFRRGTIAGTQHVVDACLRHTVRRLVYVSSLGVLAPPAPGTGALVTEDSAVDPHPELRGAYTHAKIAAEQLVREAVARHGLPAVVVRPGQIVGPGAERVVPNATLAFGRYWLAVGPPRQRLPLVYVDDVADALVLAANRPGIEGLTFHVVDPARITHEQYLARCQQLGADMHVVRVSARLLTTVAGVAELIGRLTGRDVPLTRYRVRALQPHAGFDLTAATNLLGWQPRVGVVDGLREILPFNGTPRS